MTAEACGRPPGRPRSEEADRAIRVAALDALIEEGFASMTIEGVASRAGVGKATIYRRWPGKLELVMDAVNHQTCRHLVAPDTGRIQADVLQLLGEIRRMMAGPDGRVAAALAAEQLRHPELAEAFRRQFVVEHRSALRRLVERGMARSELPDTTDAELLADAGAAIMWQRMVVTGAPLDEDLPERIAAQFFSHPAPNGPRDLGHSG